MLEFVVLGEIPGTSFQITFTQVLLVAAFLLVASELRLVAQRKNLFKSAQGLINRISF